MWECLTREDPYAGIPPFRVIFAVANEGLRPDVPYLSPPLYARLAQECWSEEPCERFLSMIF